MTIHVSERDIALLSAPTPKLPVNPSNRVGDVVWCDVKFYPKAPWTHEDPKGVARDFAWVFARDGNGNRHEVLVWKFSNAQTDECYRLWHRQ